MDKNQLVTLEITDLNSDGHGVGHAEGMAVFVPLTAPGDRCEVRVIKLAKNYAVGRLEKLVTPSPDRVEPDCPTFRRCGGCALRHISYDAELRLKENTVRQHLTRIGGVSPDSYEFHPIRAAGPCDGGRCKAQFPIARLADGRLAVGLYAAHSHNVVALPPEGCRLHPPIFAEITEAALAFFTVRGFTAYDESTKTGLLRHLYLRAARDGEQVLVCPVINAEKLPDAAVFAAGLMSRFPQITGVCYNVNRADTNVVLGEKTVTVAGSDRLVESLCGLEFELSPTAFFQVSRAGAELLYAEAGRLAALTGSETVLDLYCGTGTIGLTLAGRAARVIGVEIVPEAVADARRNAVRNGIENAEFYAADAAEAAKKLADEGTRPDVVILDPPRKGCDEALCGIVADMGAKRIVYISCDSASLARDIKRFAVLGYTLRSAAPFDLFARTLHTETAALLTR